MNVGFEAKRLFSNFTGLGNYSRFVVGALSAHYPEDRYFLYAPSVKKHPEVDQIIEKGNVEVVTPSGIFARPLFSAVWRSWGLTRHQTVKDLSIFHGLSQELPMGLPAHIKKIVTVHDLIFLRYPKFYKQIDVSIYTRKVRQACDSADCIVAISRQTAEDIQSLINVGLGKKIKVVYQGAHPNFDTIRTEQELARVRLKYNLPGQFILNVGTIEQRKNLLVLIRALSFIPETLRMPLVVIGRKTQYFQQVEQEIAARKLQKHVIFLSDASFADFPAIYQQATVFVYPSLFEGFGIPLVEAIKSRVPVITSTGSCFSEAGGPASIYVHPENAEGLAQQIVLVSQSEELRNRMVTESLRYIEQFSPPNIASKMHAVYQSVL